MCRIRRRLPLCEHPGAYKPLIFKAAGAVFLSLINNYVILKLLICYVVSFSQQLTEAIVVR
jgi:hypothetical protein